MNMKRFIHSDMGRYILPSVTLLTFTAISLPLYFLARIHIDDFFSMIISLFLPAPY